MEERRGEERRRRERRKYGEIEERKRRTCEVEVSTRKSGQVGREYPETHEEEEAEARRARDGWRKYRREWV
jgi:hypothetical protein